MNTAASLNQRLGANFMGGLMVLVSTTLGEILALAIKANVGIFSSINLGEKVGFIPANIATIGGNVQIGESLGLLDVPQLNAQASLSVSDVLKILQSSQTQSNPRMSLSEKEGLSALVNMNIQALVGISGKFVILLDSSISTNDVFAIVQTLSDVLGVSATAQVKGFPTVGFPVNQGISGSNNAILNAGQGLGILYSIVTVGDLGVIIIKGFVYTSDAAKFPVATRDDGNDVLTEDRSNTILVDDL